MGAKRPLKGVRNTDTKKILLSKAAQRLDRQNWEKDKLSSSHNNPANLCKAVKGIIGWGSTGLPTKLFHEGKYISSPAGLATKLNNYFINKDPL